MSDKYWKFEPAPRVERTLKWPTSGQLVRQLAILLVVGGLWGGLMAGFLSLTGSTGDSSDGPEPTAAAIEPTTPPTNSPPVPPATATSTSTPTSPLPSATPSPTLATTQSGAIRTASPTPGPPTATNTVSPTPEPSPTPLPPTETPAAAIGEAAEISFSNEVLPIFEQRCVKCHGGEDTEEGLELTSYQETMAGSWNGPVIEPGNVAESYLVDQIESGDMPKNEPRLLPAEIRIIRAWVEAGAPDN
jgi:mono/diheme cytochrome c family protein